MHILRQIFGCRHAHTTFPVTTNRAEGPIIHCLDCGATLHYSWADMRVGDVIPNEVLTAK